MHYGDNADKEEWEFEQTAIPGVFYLALIGDSDLKLCLTVPKGAENGSKPTLEKKLDGTDGSTHQLWRLIPSSDGVNSMIQNYSVPSAGGLMLDTGRDNAQGQVVHLWQRFDNDNQKWYIERY